MTNVSAFKQAVASAKPVVNGVLLTLSVVASVKLVTEQGDWESDREAVQDHPSCTPRGYAHASLSILKACQLTNLGGLLISRSFVSFSSI